MKVKDVKDKSEKIDDAPHLKNLRNAKEISIYNHSGKCDIVACAHTHTHTHTHTHIKFQKINKKNRRNKMSNAIITLTIFSSFTQSCPTLCDPMAAAWQASLSISNSQSLLKLMSIEPSHPLSSPSPPALNLSQHQSLFQWVSSLHQVAKVLELQLQHQSFQWIFKTDFL